MQMSFYTSPSHQIPAHLLPVRILLTYLLTYFLTYLQASCLFEFGAIPFFHNLIRDNKYCLVYDVALLPVCFRLFIS